MAYGKAGDWYINNVEGGGGETWNTVFEGSVTTVQGEAQPLEDLFEIPTGTTPLRITFNGEEYIVNESEYGGAWGAPYDDNTGSFDWSEYPFSIRDGRNNVEIITETAGTYSLKIEASNESGGNFNVAELTVVNNTSVVRMIHAPVSFENGTTSGVLYMPNEGDIAVNVILGDEGCFIEFDTSTMVIECSGGISRQTSNPNTFRMRDTGTITIVRIEG